jgi:hypothetical protein
MLLAHAVFGKHKRGVKKDYTSVWWSSERLIALGIRDRELRLQNPRLNDKKVADKICEADAVFDIFSNDSNPVRKRLPEAREMLAFWESCAAQRRRIEEIRPKIEREVAFLREAINDPRKKEFLRQRLKKSLSQDILLKVLREPGPLLFKGLLSDK